MSETIKETSAVYLTDLDACQPAAALSHVPKPGAWRLVPYETETLSGHMLLAGEETGAPEVRYGLRRTGWHRITIGVYPEGETAALQVRLTDDSSPCVLNIDQGRDYADQPRRHAIFEVAWKEADLTGQDIHLTQVCTRVDATGDGPAAQRCAMAKIAYIKLVPMSASEVASMKADRGRRGNRRLYAHNDAHGPLFLFRIVRAEELRREIEPYRNTDFSRLYWEMGAGDILYHLGEKGRLPTCDGQEDFERQGDRLHAESWREFRDRGIDPCKIALEHSHEIGLEFHAAYRTAGFYYPVPFDQWNAGGLYEQRPDLRMVMKDGREAPRISYAYPETRKIVIDILAEVARHPVDGIAILYNRRPPLVAYEPPLVEGFIRRYGLDPRELAEDDERWLQYRSIALTEFMRELRREMDAIAQKQGRKRIEISACVSNWEENVLHGLDLKTIIGEELIDTLIPYTSAPGLDSAAESWCTAEEAARWVSLTQGTSCTLSMSLLPRHQSPDEYRRKAAMLYGAGVESFFFWDSAGPWGRANYSPSWEALRRLGHREKVEEWVRTGKPSVQREPVPVLRLGEYDLSYQTPG